MPAKNRYLLPFAWSLIKFLLPFLLQHPLYELHRDEYLYLAEGDHLSWGYMEVPPLLSLFAKATDLLGGSVFWVKCWPALLGALTVWFVCLMVTELGGRAFAQSVAALCMIAGVYLRVNFLFQPTSLEIFWWTVIAYLIIKHLNTGKPSFLYLTGIAAGLAWLSKYSVAFFGAGILAGLLLTSNRKLFLERHIYLAGLLALVIALPNPVWQYSHNWPVVHHMKELRETQLAFISPADFLKDQIIMHFSYFFIWMGGLVWLFSAAGRPYRILAWMYLTVIVLLLVSSGKNYYSLGTYPMLLAAGGVWLEQLTTRRWTWLRYGAVTFIIQAFVPLIPVALPVWKPEKLAAYYRQAGFQKAGVLRWEDLQDHPLPQDFADMLGWKEMADKTSRVYASPPDSVKKNTLVYCRNYSQAGAIRYYGKGLPQVHSDNASFLFWMPDKYQVRNLLFIGARIPDKDDIVFQQFERYRVVDSVSHPLAREHGVKIILYENGNSQVNGLIEKSIREKKAEYRR